MMVLSKPVTELTAYLLEGRIAGFDNWAPNKVLHYCRDRELSLDETAAVLALIFPGQWKFSELPDNFPELEAAVALSEAAMKEG